MVLPSPQDDAAEPSQPPVRVVAGKVFVRGLRIDAEIGVYAREKGLAQPLIVDVELDAAFAGAKRLADTVNYESVGEAARAIAAQGHILLVEEFAEQLARACMSDPRVSRARVRVEKPRALAPLAEAAGVEVVVVRG